MQQLKKEIEKKIEDYQRRLKETKTMLANSGYVSDSIFVTRLTAKASCYRTIISELEKVIEDTPDLPGMEECLKKAGDLAEDFFDTTEYILNENGIKQLIIYCQSIK